MYDDDSEKFLAAVPYASTYVNLHGVTVTMNLTTHDYNSLHTINDLDRACITISSQDALKLCYETLTNGFVARLLHPSNARCLAFIVSSMYYTDELKSATELALTETERLENEWTGFMRYEHFGLQPPVRSGELAKSTADFVRLFVKMRVHYVKDDLLKQYKAWEEEHKARAMAQAKADAMRVPMPGARSVIAVR